MHNTGVKLVFLQKAGHPAIIYAGVHKEIAKNAPRLSALPYLAFYRSPSLGLGVAGRPAGAGLLANAMRVRRGFPPQKTWRDVRTLA